MAATGQMRTLQARLSSWAQLLAAAHRAAKWQGLHLASVCPPLSPSTHHFFSIGQRQERVSWRGKREADSHSDCIEQGHSSALYANRKGEGGVLSLHVEKCSSVIQRKEVFDGCQTQVSLLSRARIGFPGRDIVIF